MYAAYKVKPLNWIWSVLIYHCVLYTRLNWFQYTTVQQLAIGEEVGTHLTLEMCVLCSSWLLLKFLQTCGNFCIFSAWNQLSSLVDMNFPQFNAWMKHTLLGVDHKWHNPKCLKTFDSPSYLPFSPQLCTVHPRLEVHFVLF